MLIERCWVLRLPDPACGCGGCGPGGALPGIGSGIEASGASMGRLLPIDAPASGGT